MNSQEVFDYIEKEYGGLISPIHRAVMMYQVEQYRKKTIGMLDVDIDTLINETCRHFRITKERMMSPSRKREIVQVRQMVAWMLRKKTVSNNLSNEAIGALLGDRDHATVIHAVHTIDDLIETDASVRDNLMILLNKFGWRTNWDPQRKQLNYMAAKAA